MRGVYLSSEELDALYGLPLLSRELYMFAIRPQMDLLTGKVGVRSTVSWPGLARMLRVESAPGISEVLPTRSQLRRSADHLVRRGVIAMESEGLQLVFACLKARLPESVQNKVINKPTSKGENLSSGGIKPKPLESSGFERSDSMHEYEQVDNQKNRKPTHLRVSEIKNSLSGASNKKFSMYHRWQLVDEDRVADTLASTGLNYWDLNDFEKEDALTEFVEYWSGRPDRQYSQVSWELKFADSAARALRKRA